MFPSSEVQADHINPVIDPLVGFTTWDSVIERMFCETEGFQILCKPCHNNKSSAEKRQAKERRKKKMENYKTLPLFSDIEDSALRTRNRAVIMANVSEQHTKKNKLTVQGVALVLGYFNAVPEDERKDLYSAYESQMKERGYAKAS